MCASDTSLYKFLIPSWVFAKIIIWYVGSFLISTFSKKILLSSLKSETSYSSLIFLIHSTNISPVALASSTALWWLVSFTPKCLATKLSLTDFNSGYKNLHICTVSSIVALKGKSKSLQFFSIKLQSKLALCATTAASPINSINFGNTKSIESAYFTISSLIPVSSVIL